MTTPAEGGAAPTGVQPGTEAPANHNPATPDASNQTAQTQAPANPAEASQAPEPIVTPPSGTVEEIPSSTAEDGVTVLYDKTGDAALDVALDFVGRMGIVGNDPAMVAAANGDFSLIEAKLAVMGDKAAGWQQMVNLAKDAYQRSTAQAAAASEAIDKAVISVVGSADNWSQITAWAEQNASPEEKAAINQMIDAGPVQARAAASVLLEAYSEAKGTVINPRSPARNPSGEAPSATNTRLSPREYSAQVAALHRKLGSRMETSSEYKALRARLA